MTVNLIQYNAASTRIVRGKQPSDLPTSLSFVPRGATVSPVSTNLTNFSDVATAVREAPSFNNTLIDVSAPGAATPLTISAVNQQVGNPQLTWNSSGVMNQPLTILASDGSTGSSSFNFGILLTDRGESYSPNQNFFSITLGLAFIRPVTMQPGSLAKYMDDQVATRFAGKTYNDTNRLRWSSNNYSGTALSAVRNPNNVAVDIDMSWMSASSVRTGVGSAYSPCSLISPRHAVKANHYNPVPTRIAWIGRDGNPYYANVVSSSSLTGALNDCQLLYLDAAVSTQVTCVSILPSNYLTYIPYLGHKEYRRAGPGSAADIPPVVRVFTRLIQNNGINYEASIGNFSERISWTPLMPDDQQASGTNVDTGIYANSSGYAGNPTSKSAGDGSGAITTNGTQWCDYAIPGDSGSQIFTVINGTPVLLTEYYGPGNGPKYSGNAAQLNTEMRALASAAGDNTQYSVNEVSLSGFNTY